MKALMEDIIARFGGRLAGSIEEKRAQEYLAQKMESFCSRVVVQPFAAPMESMHGSLKLFTVVFLLNLALYWVSLPLAFALAAANAVLLAGHFLTFRYWLDGLFKKTASTNVLGIVEPKNTPSRVLIVAGHTDSTTEYWWWYRYKEVGLGLSLACAGMVLLLPAFMLLHLIAGGADAAWIYKAYWWAFALLSPISAVAFFMRSKQVVPGAQDNLSGITVAYETGRALAAKTRADKTPGLENTLLVVAAFGAEEAGLRGSAAFVEEFGPALKKLPCVCLNFDGIMHQKDLRIINTEIFPLVRYPKSIVNRLKTAFGQCGQKPLCGPLPFGATDAAAFAMKGLDAVTVIGISNTKLDYSYHTRLDTPDRVEENALEKAVEIAVEFAKDWDKAH